MQVWPDEFERLLGEIAVPGAEMDLSLAEYAKLICAIMDIPVHNGNTARGCFKNHAIVSWRAVVDARPPSSCTIYKTKSGPCP